MCECVCVCVCVWVGVRCWRSETRKRIDGVDHQLGVRSCGTVDLLSASRGGPIGEPVGGWDCRKKRNNCKGSVGSKRVGRTT
ncbi:unnamed protein product [Protopolystoma xenopodis]|uniref:Uncharacterized protein n=1 Tax=Protopolystoma xenopodis TaxID=117903 RepID=A0A3S5B559_9PLAT|nr:unnamed protein product [Protopolystoma xenopodis]